MRAQRRLTCGRGDGVDLEQPQVAPAHRQAARPRKFKNVEAQPRPKFPHFLRRLTQSGQCPHFSSKHVRGEGIARLGVGTLGHSVL